MLNKKGNENMMDLLDSEVHEQVYRFRVMRCMNDELRNPEKSWDLIFSSDSLKQTMNVCAQEGLTHGYPGGVYFTKNKFGDEFKVVDGGAV
jgi:hypothetical protein